jgi:CheY-like chemotaxis protein
VFVLTQLTLEVFMSTILIVEDDQDIRDILELTLKVEGYEVLTAINGAEAFKVLSDSPMPCLILLDLMMPVMDGWTFAQKIENDPSLADIPIVLVTAYSEKAKSVKRALRIIPKPINFDDLISTVKAHCH